MQKSTNRLRSERLALVGRKLRLPTFYSRWAMDLAWLVALLPILITAGGPRMVFWSNLTLLVVTVLIWQVLFAIARRRPPDLASVTAALGLAILLPADTSVMMIIMTASFGIVLAELIFGGRGWSFLNPVVVGITFLMFSTPALSGAQAQVATLAVLPGAALLIGSGLVHWQTPLAALLASSTAALLLNLSPQTVLVDGTALFVLIFLVADPVASAHTRIGRWAHGALVGLLIVALLPASGTVTVQALCFAALLGSIFAPLIDAGATTLAIRTTRRARNG
jgi:Na+-transporting NADH:ubiquinone oxidoreductase subunit B